jgi:hypothetical protein
VVGRANAGEAESDHKVMDSVSLDDDFKKSTGVLVGAVERRIYKAIELDQLIVLTAELLKDTLEKAQLNDSVPVSEDLESIVSKIQENADILYQIKKTLKEVYNSAQK